MRQGELSASDKWGREVARRVVSHNTLEAGRARPGAFREVYFKRHAKGI
jgi:hypothetical protein